MEIGPECFAEHPNFTRIEAKKIFVLHRPSHAPGYAVRRTYESIESKIIFIIGASLIRRVGVSLCPTYRLTTTFCRFNTPIHFQVDFRVEVRFLMSRKQNKAKKKCSV